MTTSTFDQRLQEAAQTRRDYRIELLTLGVIAGFIGGWFLFGVGRPLAEDGYITNVFTELISIVLTVFVITEIIKRREISETKKRLVRQAGSVNHQIAINAVEELRTNGWLTFDDEEPLLAKAHLSRANLEKAILDKVNLSGADLFDTNLSGANLRKANLTGANLFRTNLSNALLEESTLSNANLTSANLNGASLTSAKLDRADLFNANLSKVHMFNTNLTYVSLGRANLSNADLLSANLDGADLAFANLSGANLGRANMSGADLIYANLSGTFLVESNLVDADLSYVTLNEKTVLPDAQILDKSPDTPRYDKYWTPETDMTRYTDPNHPDFWQPDWAAAGFDSWGAWHEAGRPEPGGDESGG